MLLYNKDKVVSIFCCPKKKSCFLQVFWVKVFVKSLDFNENIGKFIGEVKYKNKILFVACVFVYIIILHKNIIMRLVFTYTVLYNIIKIFGLVSVLMIMRCLYEKTKYWFQRKKDSKNGTAFERKSYDWWIRYWFWIYWVWGI